MDSSFVIKDPTLYQWCYFRRYGSRGEVVQNQYSLDPDGYIDAFQAVLNGATEWLDGPPPTPDRKLFLDKDSRLAGVPWTIKDGLKCQLQGFSIADSFCLYVAQEATGNFTDLSVWTAPARRTEFITPPPYYVGEVDCLAVEIEEGLNQAQLATRAKELAKRWLPEAKWGRNPDIVVDCGYMARLTGTNRESFILLYSASQAAALGKVLHFVLPAMMLIYLKWRQISDSYQTNLLRKAEQAEAELKIPVSAVRQLPEGKVLSVEQLQSYNIAISRSQISLTHALTDIENRLQTLKINAKNLDMLRQSSLWGTTPSNLLLAEELDLLVQQIEGDLHYIELSRQEAGLVSGHLQSVTDIHSARNGTAMSVFLGVFAALSLPGVLNYPWPGEGAETKVWAWKIGLLIAGLGLLIMWSAVKFFLSRKIALKN